MNNLSINPKTGEYGTTADTGNREYLHVTPGWIPQFNINNEYTGMMVFGEFKSKNWYKTHWK